jgi:hypothetical protein
VVPKTALFSDITESILSYYSKTTENNLREVIEPKTQEHAIGLRLRPDHCFRSKLEGSGAPLGETRSTRQ